MESLQESLVDVRVDVLGLVDEVDDPDNVSHGQCSLLDRVLLAKVDVEVADQVEQIPGYCLI